MKLRRVVLLGCALCACSAGLVAASCTTFDGLTVSESFDSAINPVDASDAKPPPIDASPDARTPPSYLALPDAARVCALVFRCPMLAPSIITSSAVPVDPLNYAACMDWVGGPLPENRVGIPIQAGMLACVAKASTCQQAGECLALEQFATNDPRCLDASAPDAAKERCVDDGGTVLRCGGSYALHCGAAYYAPGSRCTQGADKSHWCATGANCAQATSCVGSLLDYCGAGSNLTEGINCAALGYTCGVNPEGGSPDCLTGTTLKRCGALGTDCAANAVTVCDGYQISEFDCALLGGTCTKKGSSARCARATDACSPFDASANVCSGTSISLCLGGQRSSFDCASAGLSCKPGAGAQSAHCG